MKVNIYIGVFITKASSYHINYALVLLNIQYNLELKKTFLILICISHIFSESTSSFQILFNSRSFRFYSRILATTTCTTHKIFPLSGWNTSSLLTT